MKVQRSSANKFIPFWIVQNGGDYRGRAGLSPTVQLSKDGRAPVAAVGAIVDSGTGLYWLTPDPADRDTIGMVLVLVTAPAGYIVSPAEYEVVPYDPDASPSPQGITINSGLNPQDSNNLRLLTKYSIPAQFQGEIQ